MPKHKVLIELEERWSHPRFNNLQLQMELELELELELEVARISLIFTWHRMEKQTSRRGLSAILSIPDVMTRVLSRACVCRLMRLNRISPARAPAAMQATPCQEQSCARNWHLKTKIVIWSVTMCFQRVESW